MTEPTDREVEALAKAIHDEMWPGATWDPDGYNERRLLNTAHTILRREAALVAALNDTIGIASDSIYSGGSAAYVKMKLQAHRDRVLAAHRAATRPEPTLAEAVEAAEKVVREALNDAEARVREALRAALAREQERGR